MNFCFILYFWIINYILLFHNDGKLICYFLILMLKEIVVEINFYTFGGFQVALKLWSYICMINLNITGTAFSLLKNGRLWCITFLRIWIRTSFTQSNSNRPKRPNLFVIFKLHIVLIVFYVLFHNLNLILWIDIVLLPK